MLWIAFAVIFLVAIFLIKTKSIFKNTETYQRINQENGLSYGDATVEDLVNRDTDNDGILDWEESLSGTDPTKKDTDDDGIMDNIEIENSKNQDKSNEGTSLDPKENEKLSKTDQFSRELFSTIVSLNQNGAIDQAAIEKLSASLADNIQNTPPRKVFSISEIKINNDNSVQAFRNYNNNFDNIKNLYTTNYTVLDVLQEFTADENNVDISVLSKLDPIIDQTNTAIE